MIFCLQLGLFNPRIVSRFVAAGISSLLAPATVLITRDVKLRYALDVASDCQSPDLHEGHKIPNSGANCHPVYTVLIFQWEPPRASKIGAVGTA